MANVDEIQGSWFPTGFHGHFRSKTRTDFNIPYRQRAKPKPPVKFLNQTKERSNRHLFSRHDNRNAHSNVGDLEAFFNMGLGKRKYLSTTDQSIPSQHTKSTKDMLTWKGNENNAMVTTYRRQFDRRSMPAPGFNEYEPVHVRSNLHLQRRHFRAVSAPPSQRRTAPLLAWNEPDDSFSSRPGIGSHHLTQNQTFSHSTPARPSNTSNFTVAETITPLNTR
ncbi:uncharacterized protein C3orf84-like [Actinia tenebrosa]|uniref:Uncharacterized protein C3orf84-like n=1 Tax=Actinia tenebrosa TaxID=6105 RepID=A0A6P8I4R1_ACTTE|nr:uncharacterized protein C3orf84-like [Actinia tenebrosa]